MFFAADTKRAGPGPAAPARIVDFGARHTLQAIVTACDEHAPIEEQRGSVTKASVSQTAGARPCSGGAIVKLRRRQVIGFIAVPSGGQHFSVQKGCHGKPRSSCIEPVALHAPAESEALSPAAPELDMTETIRSGNRSRR